VASFSQIDLHFGLAQTGYRRPTCSLQVIRPGSTGSGDPEFEARRRKSSISHFWCLKSTIGTWTKGSQ
jgi:hypothetical protein